MKTMNRLSRSYFGNKLYYMTVLADTDADGTRIRVEYSRSLVHAHHYAPVLWSKQVRQSPIQLQLHARFSRMLPNINSRIMYNVHVHVYWECYRLLAVTWLHRCLLYGKWRPRRSCRFIRMLFHRCWMQSIAHWCLMLFGRLRAFSYELTCNKTHTHKHTHTRTRAHACHVPCIMYTPVARAARKSAYALDVHPPISPFAHTHTHTHAHTHTHTHTHSDGLLTVSRGETNILKNELMRISYEHSSKEYLLILASLLFRYFIFGFFQIKVSSTKTLVIPGTQYVVCHTCPETIG